MTTVTGYNPRTGQSRAEIPDTPPDLVDERIAAAAATTGKGDQR
jgi:hypothetical protein